MRNPFARRKSTPEPESAETEPLPAQQETAATTPASVAKIESLGIKAAVKMLVGGGATRAIFISPEGDEGAATAVMVAREIADKGLRALLIDLTISGAASRPMLDTTSRFGITNLLVSEARFTEAVHIDLYSDCHVMPVGTADPLVAMKSAGRLPSIVQSLISAYDIVVIECGSADADSIRMLVADDTEILVSAIDSGESANVMAEELSVLGYARVTLVSPASKGAAEASAPNPPEVPPPSHDS